MAEPFAPMRGETHGDYTLTAKVAQELKDVLGHGNYNLLSPVARESLDQIATKMARIVCGKWDEVDHWNDIGGYAKLVADRIAQAPAARTESK